MRYIWVLLVNLRINFFCMKLILATALLITTHTQAQFLADAARPIGRSAARPLPVTTDGKQIAGPGSEIAGSPFFMDNWYSTNVQLTNGDIVNAPKARLDMMGNTLHYIDSRGVEMYVEAKEISRIEFTADSELHIFKVHTISKAGKEIAVFYKVLAEGKIVLLKQIKKQLEENKNGFTQELTKEIVTKETTYVFFNNALTQVKNKESFWKDLMADKWADIQIYAGTNDLSFTSPDDIQKIVAYYNASK
jgi:hypothetical protein